MTTEKNRLQNRALIKLSNRLSDRTKCEKITEKERQTLAILFKTDLLTAAALLGFQTDNLDDIHYEMADFLMSREVRKKLMLVPRGHIKTTLDTVSIIQDVARFPYQTQLVCTSIKNLSKEIVGTVKRVSEVKAQLLHWLFPRIFYRDPRSEADKWTETELRFMGLAPQEKEHTVTAGSAEGLTGGHYDLIRLDDIVDKENVNTADQIQKVKDFYKTLTPLFKHRHYGGLLVIGTRWDLTDLYGDLELDDDFVKLIRAWHTGDGQTPIWHNHVTPQMVTDWIKNSGQYFSCWYENNPMPESKQLFRPENFRPFTHIIMRHELEKMKRCDTYKPAILDRKLCVKVLLMDPAFTEKQVRKACKTAFMVIYIDPTEQIYIMKIVEMQAPSDDIDWEEESMDREDFANRKDSLAQTAADLIKDYDIEYFFIEDANAQKWFFNILSAKLKRLNDLAGFTKYRRPSYQTVRTKGVDKTVRLRRMQSRVNSLMVFCNHLLFIENVCMFPQCRDFRDSADLFAYVYDVMAFIRVKVLPRKSPEAEWEQDETGRWLLNIDTVLQSHLKDRKRSKEGGRLCR